MAEAAASPKQRYYCHCCKGEVDPKLPELICPSCESDFIEEVTEGSGLLEAGDRAVVNEDVSTQFSELWQLLFMERSAVLLDPTSSVSDDIHSDEGSGDSSAGEDVENHVEQPSSGVTEPINLSQQPSQHRQAVEGIVQQFLTGLFANNGNASSTSTSWPGMLHSNPGDYAWGQGGLDTVITQLLGQLENTGPPPAEKEMISSLPTVTVSQEQAGRLECPVCREAYEADECVRQLPCLHYFHSNCIVPWLQLHDTCPVCRKSLSGDDHSLLSQPQPSEPSTLSTEPQGQGTL
ncbi:E3 ubiquitin-protein ligase RNF115 isoform X2 [Denticeps clupeoides]|uniref:E3 ubiquitin-protein ligase RNF115 isoform X2 n=1 Tax=Denticeps clupeoides TaxID=299321 RepID=UPI0010A34C0B|nr:E3 ubiquitin-protein ligase RNF115-like isoform X2 [Denticeps clupeoides]